MRGQKDIIFIKITLKMTAIDQALSYATIILDMMQDARFQDYDDDTLI